MTVSPARPRRGNPIKLIISAGPFVQSVVSQKEEKKQMGAILETG